MSQRNPMNERYTLEKNKGGKTRRSAASAKPKSSAASSVIVGVKNKKKGSGGSRANKREQRKRERDKEYAAERKYGDPPTKRFKMYRKIWIGCLVCAILSIVASFACSKVDFMPEGASVVFLVLAYAFIIVTLYLDFGKIRKERRAYSARMAAQNTKESRAAQKAQKAAARKRKKEEEQRKAKEEAERAARGQLPFKDKVKAFFKKPE